MSQKYRCASWKYKEKLFFWLVVSISAEFLLPVTVIYFLFIYFVGGKLFYTVSWWPEEQLAFAILERGAKDRKTWVTGDVKDFEICLSSCHCNGHRTNTQNVALHCQGLLYFWQHILNSP